MLLRHMLNEVFWSHKSARLLTLLAIDLNWRRMVLQVTVPRSMSDERRIPDRVAATYVTFAPSRP
jgi:hypothetical protein